MRGTMLCQHLLGKGTLHSNECSQLISYLRLKLHK